MVALPCDCESECHPSCTSCAVMLVHDPHGWCEFFCNDCATRPGPPVTIKGDRRTITRGDLINFNMRNATIGEAAQLLAGGADADGAYADAAYAEILVPASRINERRDLRLESVSLDTVLRELGLTAVEPAR